MLSWIFVVLSEKKEEKKEPEEESDDVSHYTLRLSLYSRLEVVL